MREREISDGVRDGLWISVLAVLMRRRAKRTSDVPRDHDVPHRLEPVRCGHETTDASAKGLLIFAICMAITLILIALAPLPIRLPTK